VRSEAFAAVDTQVDAWNKGTPASSLATAGWSSHEWLHFLRGLPPSLPQPRLAELDRAFHLSDSGNSEILEEWLLAAIRNHYTPAWPALDRFLTSQGRRKFLKPLYQELAKTEWGRALAHDVYRRARPTYHSVSTTTIDQILKWQ
jgi:hypothetical protein